MGLTDENAKALFEWAPVGTLVVVMREEAAVAEEKPVQSLLGFVQLGLYICGLLLLFHRDASGWFGAQGSGPR